jgi:alpha-tubulin suppressor-like RCC1 family protein
MHVMCREKRSWSGLRGRAGKGRARGRSVVLAVSAAALCLTGLTAASAASAAQQPAGTALAWGANFGGQLGDGSATNRATPVPVDLPALTRVTAVAAGDVHSLALTSGGRVLAWGGNFVGQLGDGSTTDSSTPVRVHLPAGTRFTAVAAGDANGLALTSGGRVLAWGGNFAGQLGDGTSTDRSTPVLVHLPAHTRVTAVAAGADHSLALTSGGRVLAWGDNLGGELGDGSTTTGSSTPVLVQLPARTRVTAVAAGDEFSLALTSDGRVLAWGANFAGQLGDGSTSITDSSTPVRVDLPAGTRVTAVAAGTFHSLALTSDGRVLAWGNNGWGQLGDGTSADSSTPVLVHLPALTRVTAVTAGAFNSLALTSGGRVLAWGNNEYGQLGDGTSADSSIPVLVDLPACTRFTAVAAGDDYNLALAGRRARRH